MTGPAPRTAAGRKVLDSWRLVDEYGAPNERVVRDAILVIEMEAWRLGAEHEHEVAEAAALHDHDPDKCDECQEMVMEALRD